MKTLIFAICALTLAACSATPPQYNDAPRKIPGLSEYVATMIEAPNVSADMAEGRRKLLSDMDLEGCADKGGSIVAEGMLGGPHCLLMFPDGGEPCTGSEQCMGDCRADSMSQSPAGQPATGQCTMDNRWAGCYSRVEDGRAAPALCVD